MLLKKMVGKEKTGIKAIYTTMIFHNEVPYFDKVLEAFKDRILSKSFQKVVKKSW